MNSSKIHNLILRPLHQISPQDSLFLFRGQTAITCNAGPPWAALTSSPTPTCLASPAINSPSCVVTCELGKPLHVWLLWFANWDFGFLEVDLNRSATFFCLNKKSPLPEIVFSGDARWSREVDGKGEKRNNVELRVYNNNVGIRLN